MASRASLFGNKKEREGKASVEEWPWCLLWLLSRMLSQSDPELLRQESPAGLSLADSAWLCF